jgi:hypothetical protein
MPPTGIRFTIITYGVGNAVGALLRLLSVYVTGHGMRPSMGLLFAGSVVCSITQCFILTPIPQVASSFGCA